VRPSAEELRIQLEADEEHEQHEADLADELEDPEGLGREQGGGRPGEAPPEDGRPEDDPGRDFRDHHRLPQAPEHVRGVTNLRGRILPVVELRSRLGLATAAVTPKSRIVVTEAHGRILGLLVDAVLQVTRIPADSVQPPPEDILTPQADWLAGVARRSDRLLILLDLDAVLLLHR
jgi:hypothetical protein